MNSILINISIVLTAFAGMEVVAWLTHKYVMHGLLWRMHSDHHRKESDSFLERNDFFFLIFALPGIACLLMGSMNDFNFLFWTGLGITLYGFAYLVHDIFIHQRIRIFSRTESWYLKAIRRAHKMHHKHTGKEDGECFGMLWVPFKYYKDALKK
jgi:beta-carotene 3-hydroxylase